MKKMGEKLEPGLYEQVISEKLATLLSTLPEGRSDERRIDPAEAAEVLTGYLSGIVRQGLSEIGEAPRPSKNSKEATIPDSLAAQISLANEIISLIRKRTRSAQGTSVGADTSDEDLIDAEGKQLLGITREKALPLAPREHLPRPETSLVETSLFTGTANQEPSMESELNKEIQSADRIDLLVSFIKWSGYILLRPQLEAFTQRGGRLRVIATAYMGATDSKAIDDIASLKNTTIRISYDTKRTRLHAKAYIFYRETGFDTAYIGSSNLSGAALTSGLEWNIKLTRYDSPTTTAKVQATFESYWQSPDFEPYTLTDKPRLEAALEEERHPGTALSSYHFTIRPYAYQRQMLDEIAAERELRNNYRNLVVAATGTGKTVLAAFDYLRFMQEHPSEKCSLLFVAHREEILEQSLSCFRGILQNPNFGSLLVGAHSLTGNADADHLFLSIQTFKSREWWKKTTKDAYDYIVIDEVHHAAAQSYRQLLDYYQPQILLGLTATPERMDGRDILTYFGGHITTELRLFEAIERSMLVPFHYFGVTDTVDLSQLAWTRSGYQTSDLNKVYVFSAKIAEQRVDNIIRNLRHYTTDLSTVHGVGFCVSCEHAKFMANRFNAAGIPSRDLSGLSQDDARHAAKAALESGEIRFIFVVDLYNEGVDIPNIDTILFLRPTQSLTIFLQQLGRGLRLAPGKEFLTVLDFIGQANRKYRFAEKFAALVRKTKHSISEEIKSGLPNVPSGCCVQLERIAQDYVLDNIRHQLATKNHLISLLQDFQSTGEPLSLENFLAFARIPLTDIYKSSRKEGFMRLAAIAGCRKEFTEPDEKLISRALPRFASFDDAEFCHFCLRVLSEPESIPQGLPPLKDLYLKMLYFTFWDASLEHETTVAVIREKLSSLSRNPVLLGEVQELIAYRLKNIRGRSFNNTFLFPCPLRVHAHYTRNQICAAFDMLMSTSLRQGVYQIKEKHCDLFFVTLKKSEKDYSPTTMYHDYSINDTLFHWESQSTTAAESPTAQRYFNHRELGQHILLFVREYKEDTLGKMPYLFLGEADYVSHEGSRPVSIVWRLRTPIPADFINVTNKLVNE